MLTDTRIRTAKPRAKPYKLTDGKGLYVEVKPTGAKLWRYRYRIGDKENVFAAGEYAQPQAGETPAQAEARQNSGWLTLSEARIKRQEWRGLVKQGIHPAHQRKLEKLARVTANANTFEAVAREWLAKQKLTPASQRQRRKLLERDVFPQIGALPIRQVQPAHVLAILEKLAVRAPTMAVMARQLISSICCYAVSTLRADTDPTAPVRDAVEAPKTKHKTPLKLKEIPAFLTALEGDSASFTNKIALRLTLLTLARTTEILGARWPEIDFEQAQWHVPAERMKMREPHTIPLSRQALDLLKRLHAVTGDGEFLFPNRSHGRKAVSLGVLWKTVDRMGYAGRFTPHGIRATGSTILNEMGFRPEWIDRQLAHKERNKTRASYNQAEYLQERREMMQEWADLLDGNVNIIAGRFGKAA